MDPSPFGNLDGSDRLLSMLNGLPETYREWASTYYEREIPLKLIKAVYQHRPLTDELVAALNPHQNMARLACDIAEIGYPACP